MEITIKKIGKANGTIGWLAVGLASGNIRLEEGHAKNGGNHGLWLKGQKSNGEKISQCIAIFNQYDLTEAEYAQAMIYATIAPEQRHLICTAACWSALLAIAEQWCDACNAEAVAELAPAIKIVRAEVAHA